MCICNSSGVEEPSSFSRCPYFRGVGFHCIAEVSKTSCTQVHNMKSDTQINKLATDFKVMMI